MRDSQAMRRYDVYIVRCSDGSYYTGITNDVDRRIGEHNDGIHPKAYTYRRRPVRLVYVSEFLYVWQAIDWEKRIKKWSRVKKEALINQEYEKLPELAKKDFTGYKIRKMILSYKLYVQRTISTALCHGE